MDIKEDLFFLRHGKVLLPYKDHSEMPFDILAKLGASILNPPIDETALRERFDRIRDMIPVKEITHIVASPRERCQHTAKIILETLREGGGHAELETEPLLTEVAFDLEAMNADSHVETGLRNHGIAAVNTAVFEGMVTGVHCEPLSEILKRVEKIFVKYASRPGATLFITHDFFLRVVELYIRRRRSSPSVSLNDLESTQRNPYFSGFATDRELHNFRSIISNPRIN